MTANLIRLFPLPGGERPLEGTYLEHRVHELGTPGAPFVYANFVTSLDGRIALRDEQTGRSVVPKALTSATDFRLFLELQAQADCLITHGGYLRAIADGTLADILQVGGEPETRDLADWRRAQGLPPQPAIAVASASLDFLIPHSVNAHAQPLYIVTGQGADPARVRELRRQGWTVLIAGGGKRVEGAPLVRALGELGYRSLYLVAGPIMLHAMLADCVLSRLYLTITHQVLGGTHFNTIVSGGGFAGQQRLRLRSLYYDPHHPEQSGQWFSQFDCSKT